MQIKSFGKSDVGRKREKNEDSFSVNDENFIYIVTDGMGGHLGGEYASKLAVTTIEEVIRSLEDDPEATMPGDISLKPGDISGEIRFAISVASRRIYEKANVEKTLHGMGTTAVVLMFREGKVYIANVGDSRGYQVRSNNISQITKDHSLVSEQIRAGILSEEDSRVHRFKNIITRSVGYQEQVESDVDIRIPRVGDQFLLCSDGLTNLVKDEEIRDIIVNNEIELAVQRLIDVANERGGDDNITAILVEVVGLDDSDLSCKEHDDSTIEM